MNKGKREIIDPVQDKMNIKNSIKKQPTNNLNECLNYYTKDKIFDLAKNHDDHISKSNLKAEMIELAEEIILKNIEKDYEVMTIEEKDVMNKVLKDEEINQRELRRTENFKELGYLYWFYDEKEIKVRMPDEIKEKYKTYETSNIEEKPELENKVLNHIKALKEIYGIFEVNQIIQVWKKYNKEILNKEYLHEVLEGTGDTHEDFWWSAPYIVSKDFKGKDEYEEFLKTRMGKKYYSPTKAEMNYYKRNEFQLKNRYYRRIENYFKENGSLNQETLNDLMEFIELSCRLNNSFKDVLEDIKTSGFKFSNQNEINKLSKDYSLLNNSTRKWNLKGYKPTELSRNKKTQSSNIRTDQSRKIGRNELCPCGSGKKYKFCCID